MAIFYPLHKNLCKINIFFDTKQMFKYFCIFNGTSNNSLRHCGLDPQSPKNKEILKQVQNDGGYY